MGRRVASLLGLYATEMQYIKSRGLRKTISSSVVIEVEALWAKYC